ISFPTPYLRSERTFRRAPLQQDSSTICRTSQGAQLIYETFSRRVLAGPSGRRDRRTSTLRAAHDVEDRRAVPLDLGGPEPADPGERRGAGRPGLRDPRERRVHEHRERRLVRLLRDPAPPLAPALAQPLALLAPDPPLP